MILSNKIFSFFKKLKLNNHRDWFIDNKRAFKLYETQVKVFGE